jgi:RNA-directed DNA polymerase
MRNCVNPNQVSLFDLTQNSGATERERERERVRLRLVHVYDNIVSIENLLVSWQEFLRGKRKRKDVAKFSLTFIDSIIQLHEELVEKTYRHGSYFAFKISDPKPRNIHKAGLRDRIVHHAVYRILYPYFDRKFIFDSYSCRKNKGTHKAVNRFREFGRKVSHNNTRTAWVLKGDIKKFFANIDHEILKNILRKYIEDIDALSLLEKIINSFDTKDNVNVGIPLGNLTSQLLVNIYMNEFDQFVKRKLKAKYYIRYADDFIIFHEDKLYLEELIPKLSEFLETELKLSLHPKKVFIKTLASGVDFLGWINFTHYRIPRTSTKRRMLKRLQENESKETLASCLGLLGHGNTHKLIQKIRSRSLRD